MAIGRSDILTYISNTFAALGSKLTQTFTDTASTYKPVIDQVFLDLGVAAADLASASVADSNLHKAYALAEYYALSKMYKAAAAQIDITSDAPVQAGQRSQLFQHIRDLLKEAKERVEELGLDTSNYTVGLSRIRWAHDPYIALDDDYRVVP